ncbi:hypothetical protein [Rhodococcus sp. APC 3903]|uniref:hypothetical protein n=1 Tax=Rhodococcus sp. APC 3903 TaxID=3035193 RepID=UPI0025B53F79|nr:hypothetical protein [Rhodococcus sp. APC 3903]MDN3460950.1 hypothetical protein [Rhodococcus sp. APC 3903]
MKTKPVVVVVVALLLALASYTVASWISSDTSWGSWVSAVCLASLVVLSVWTMRNIDAEPAKIILTVYSVTTLSAALAALVAESYTRAVGIAAASVVFVAFMADRRGRAWLNRLGGENSAPDR